MYTRLPSRQVPDYSIVPATIAHVHQLARVMREADAGEARGLGHDPRRLLRASFRSSLYSRTGFVGSSIAAMWGVSGDILSDTGMPWLVTAPIVETVPLTFLRLAKSELENMLYLKPRLENYVIADYRGAVRLLEVLGFRLDDAAPYGARGVMFRRFWIEA